MQALWGEPRTARSVFAIDDGNEVVLFEEMSPISGCLPSHARWSRWRSEGKARSREDEMAVPPRVLTRRPVSMLRIRFLPLVFSQCFRVPYPNTAEKSQSINGHQNRKRNFGRQSTISCAWKTGKEGQNACRKIQIEFVSKGRWTSDAVSEITKNRALAQASFRRKIILNQSQRKARAKYGICAGFWFGSSWAQSQAVGRSIYIYIYISPMTKVRVNT